MLNVFVDDSGTDGQGPLCVLAGYIADADSWKAFSQAWAGELRTDPEIAHFKMSQAHGRRGPFREWDDDTRDRKVMKLIEVINRHAAAGIACLVGHQQYKAIAKGCLPDTVDNPYWLCFQRIVLESLRLYGHQRGGGKINFVFDTQGEGYERRAALMHNGLRSAFEGSPYAYLLGDITFASDADQLPLQAADLLAWHVRRRGVRAIEGQPEGRPADDLLGRVPILMQRWLPDEIADFVDEYQRFHPLSPTNRPDLHIRANPKVE